MKRIVQILFIVYLGLPFSVSAQASAKFITVSNTSTFSMKNAVVTIPWVDILKKYPAIDTSGFKVVLAASKKEIPFQLEYRGQPEVRNLLLQLSVGAKSAVKIEIRKGKPAVFASKTYARYVPERKDDFTWENDKIAFRMYGKALEGSKENAYGIDVWVKRTDKLIINERYKRGEYHVDHGDGMDYYHVGLSLGAGNMAPYVKDTIRYSKNYTSWKVLDNGPLRSTFQLGYDAWDVAGTAVKATKTVSLDAGSRLSRVEVTYSYAGTAPMPVTVGISKRKEPGSIILDEQAGITAYWEPQHGSDGITGVGSILTGPMIRAEVTDEQLLAITRVKSNEPVIYYTGAAWNKAGEITDAASWFNYLYSFKKVLQNPLKVEIQ
jgi:hypothetical protein